MNKLNEQDVKLKFLAVAVLGALLFIGNKVYRYYNPTKEEQAEQAALKLQKALKEKLEDELIHAANELNKDAKHKKITNEIKHDSDIEMREESGIKTTVEAPITPKARKTVTGKDVDVTAFGITIGKTTEEDIRDNFQVIEELNVIESDKHKALILGTNSFSSTELPVKQAFVILNEQGIVEQLKIIFDGQYFSKLHPVLNQKYKLKQKQDPFVGDHVAYYSKGNTIIVLEEPHMGGFETTIVYLTEEFNASVEAYRERQQQQRKQQLQEQL